MKFTVLLLFSFCVFTSFAQQVVDITETDCDANSVSVFEALEGNKPLFVVASGYDCSICKNEAPGYAVLADSLVGRVSVWGAMNYRFSSTRVPTCQELESWKSSYNWDNFFMFNDNNNNTNKTWAQGGYTSYTVIDPITKEYSYRGVSSSKALDSLFSILERLEKVTSTKSINDVDFDFSFANNVVNYSGEIVDDAVLTVVNTSGKVLISEVINTIETTLTELPQSELLLFSLTSSKGTITKKIIL